VLAALASLPHWQCFASLRMVLQVPGSPGQRATDASLAYRASRHGLGFLPGYRDVRAAQYSTVEMVGRTVVVPPLAVRGCWDTRACAAYIPAPEQSVDSELAAQFQGQQTLDVRTAGLGIAGPNQFHHKGLLLDRQRLPGGKRCRPQIAAVEQGMDVA
jgi:hypothetical protein